MNDKFRELTDRRLEDVKVDERLKTKILDMVKKSGTDEGTAAGRKLRFGLAFPLAICFCILFSIAVVAAVPQLREKFSRILSPDYEDFAPAVTPDKNGTRSPAGPAAPAEQNTTTGNRGAYETMGNAAVDQGIRVEVINAVTDGKTMVMYISVQSDEGRLDDTVDIHDYAVNGFTFLNTQLIGFDSSTNTAKFCLLASGGKVPAENKIRCRISSLTTNSKTYEGFDTGILPRSLIREGGAGEYVYCLGGGGDRGMMTELKMMDEIHVLETDRMAVSFRDDIDFVTISNAGYLDGYLHIQTKWDESVDNHGDVWLLDQKGERVPYINLSFDHDDRGNYIEYIYDLNNVDLDNCSLNAFFVKTGEHMEGNWNMEFTVSSVENQFVEVDGQGLAERAVITPLGICLYDTQLMGEDLTEITIDQTDGAFVQIAGRFTERSGENRNLILVSETPLEPEKLKRIVLNGKILYERQAGAAGPGAGAAAEKTLP